MNLRCPECGETEVNELQPNILDRVVSLFGGTPYRCTFCRKFFHSTARKAPVQELAQPVASPRRAA